MLGNIGSDLMRIRPDQIRPDIKSLPQQNCLHHPDTLDQSLIPQTATLARYRELRWIA